MTTIFLSHSQRDAEIIQIFSNAFNDTKVVPILMEYEKFTNPPWKEIKNRIQNSSALFVLLGPNIQYSEYTKHWIIYEIGIADSFNKQIWIFEDVRNEVFFPIPHVNHYVLYDQFQSESLNYLQEIIKSYATNPYGALGGLLLGAAVSINPIVALAGLLIGSKLGIPSKPLGIRLTCPYEDCRITFEFYHSNRDLTCPSCRRYFHWEPPNNP